MTMSRQEQLSEIRTFINDVNKDITMILQSLHWDKETLLKSEPMVICKYDTNHRIPVRTQEKHEKKCFLKSQGYEEDELFLSDTLNPDASTVVKFTAEQINQIIENASKNDPLFKRGSPSVESQPLTLSRLTSTYTTDERRAIHDAVVNAMPSFHDLSDLALPSSSAGSAEGKPKSRLEVLSELRDMKRRRTKYRVSGAASNYSHTLRELIATQMEIYTGIKPNIKIEPIDKTTKDKHTNQYEDTHERGNGKYKMVRQENSKHKEVTREVFRDREHKYKERDSRSSIKHERQSEIHSRERDRRYGNDERKRDDKCDSYSRSSSSRDRKRHHDRSDRERHRDRSADKYNDRRDRVEHKRYYDDDYDYRCEKQEKHSSKEKSRRKN